MTREGLPIRFIVPGAPVAKARPRFVPRGRGYAAITPPATEAAEQYFAAIALRYRPATPIEGPIAVRIECTFLPPGGRQALWRRPHATKPDIDNLAKLVLDSVARAGYFAVGDQQVSDLEVVKRYGLHLQTTVVIRRPAIVGPTGE